MKASEIEWHHHGNAAFDQSQGIKKVRLNFSFLAPLLIVLMAGSSPGRLHGNQVHLALVPETKRASNNLLSLPSAMPFQYRQRQIPSNDMLH